MSRFLFLLFSTVWRTNCGLVGFWFGQELKKRKSVVVQAKDDDGLDYMMAIKMDEKR